MARIIYEHHENTTRANTEADLATRELGYTDEAGRQELVFMTNAGSYRHFASLERFDDAAAAASSGAKLIGYYPSGGLVSTTVQDVIDEMWTAVASRVTGSGTAGYLPQWSSSTVLTNSITNYASGEFTQTFATAGTKTAYNVTHSDNTNGSSHARSRYTVGGASGGDPYIVFTISGATDWSIGIDNSASDTFVISASSSLGTTNIFSTTTGGVTTLGGTGQFIAPDGGGLRSTISSNRTMVLRSGTELEVGDGDGWTEMNFRINTGGFYWTIGSSPTQYMSLGTNGVVIGSNGHVAISSAYLMNVSRTGANVASAIAAFGSGFVPVLSFEHTGGTATAKTATPSGDTLAYIEVVGYGTSTAAKNPISVKTTELWSGTAHGYEIVMNVTQATTTTARQILQIRADDIQIGNVTSNPTLQFLGTGTATFGGNVSITRSSSGGQVLHTISNTSNSASSTARLLIQIAGSSAGDADIAFTRSGGNTFTLGYNNLTDAFLITKGTALSGATYPNFGFGSLFAQLLFDSNSVVDYTFRNVNAGASSGMRHLLYVDGGTGDAATVWGVYGGQNYILGLDNSASDALVLSSGSSLGTNNLLSFSTTVATWGVQIYTLASTTTRAGVIFPSGTAPSSPVDGEWWYDGTNLKFRNGGTTRTISWT